VTLSLRVQVTLRAAGRVIPDPMKEQKAKKKKKKRDRSLAPTLNARIAAC
jgi:hypothetical protein